MNKINELEKLQQTLQEIFLKNLNFFKKHQKNLYEKIIEFDKMNIENYSLEFIDQKFQLINLIDNFYFYDKDPFLDATNKVNNFDFSSAFTLIKLDLYKKRNHYEDEINSYLYINKFIENFSNITPKIEKFVFIGTLLGVHINDFHKKLNAKTYLIIEPNIEIFKLSMFMTDYAQLANDSKLFFVINENEFNTNKIISDFLEYKHELNNLIYYEKAHQIYEPWINKLSLIFTQSSQMRYPFSEYIISLKRGYKYFFEEKRKIINLSKKYNFLENKKVIFLGAGVSLAKNLEWLYLNQNRFIIVATSAVLKHLQILDIVPDIIILIDGQKDCMIEQFEVKEIMYKNSIILASIKIDIDLYEQIKNSNIFFMQNSLELFKGFGFLSGVTVGDIGVDILSKFGVKELYLLGVDASLDPVNGKTHVGTHKSSKKINLNKKNDAIDFQENIIYVKGNFEKEVPTFLEYKEMIENLNSTLLILDNKIKVFNLSNGAYFQNTTPLKIQDLKIEESIEKDIFKEDLISNLNNISKEKLNNLDINEIQKEQKILNKLSSINKKDFIKTFESLKQKFQTSIVINIFDKYLKLVLPYYNFLSDNTLANDILDNQINEILNKFNSIFDKINTKIDK